MTGHSLTLGSSQSGKTTLAKILARQSIQNRRRVLVLDSVVDLEWRKMGAILYRDPEKFIADVKKEENWSSFLIVDEGGTTINRDRRMNFITTTARHYGHTTFVIAHDPIDVPRVLRTNVDRVFVFSLSPESTGLLSSEWAGPDGRRIPIIEKQGDFAMLRRFKPPKYGRVIFAERRIVWLEPKSRKK